MATIPEKLILLFLACFWSINSINGARVGATPTARAESDDPIAIMNPADDVTGLASCSTVETTTRNVRIKEIKVAGPAGDVEFTRSYIDGDSVDGYVDSSQTSITPATTFKECADKTAATGKHGFTFSGSTCSSYVFVRSLCPCQQGDTVIYVDLTKLADLPIDLSIETDDYISLQLDLTIMDGLSIPGMGLTLVGAAATFEDCLAYDNDTSPAFTFSDGVCHNFEADAPIPAEGLEGCAGTTVYKRKPLRATEIDYFNDSCGETFVAPRGDFMDVGVTSNMKRIYSHPGFGSEPMPEKEEDCVVTFVGEETCHFIEFTFTPLYLDANEACTEGDYITFAFYEDLGTTLEEGILCGDSETPTGTSALFGEHKSASGDLIVTLTQDQTYDPSKTSTGFFIDYSCIMADNP